MESFILFFLAPKLKKMSTYVQYGCGLCAPSEWKNFDASPTLRIQKNPFLNLFSRHFQKVKFPSNVVYGDIVKGLPLNPNSCAGLYCSHVLEHLSLEDFRRALANSFQILKPGGIFRLVMPDLNRLVENYISAKNSNDVEASIKFISSTLLGQKSRSKSLRGLLESAWGNSNHLWLWDVESTMHELKKVGFENIRICQYNDSVDNMFKLVESEDRFQYALAIEAIK